MNTEPDPIEIAVGTIVLLTDGEATEHMIYLGGTSWLGEGQIFGDETFHTFVCVRLAKAASGRFEEAHLGYRIV